MEVCVITYGGRVVRSLMVPDRDGKPHGRWC